MFGGSMLGWAQFAHSLRRENEEESYRDHVIDMQKEDLLNNYIRQKEFAQHGIQWKADDARAAGLHPVFAMGGATTPYAPSSTINPPAMGEDHVGTALARMGQDVSRSVAATQTAQMKLRQELENDLLKAQIDKTRREAGLPPLYGVGTNRLGDSQVGPGMPEARPGDGVILGADRSSVQPSTGMSADSQDLSRAASDPSPFSERFVVKGADGQDVVIRLPSGGKGTPTESLESLSESPLIAWAILQDNLRENPNLLYELRHAIPGGQWYYDVRDELSQVIEKAMRRAAEAQDNFRRGRRAASRMLSGRERGINWRSGR